MKNISFFKYMLKNGVIPLGIITLIFIGVCIYNPEPGYDIVAYWIGFLWIIMTIFNYVLWKTGIPDLFSAIRSLFK